MKSLSKLALMAALAGGTLCGTGCTTDLRDAVLAGVLDYVTGTTTALVEAISPLDNLVAE